MVRKKPLGQESELKMQRERSGRTSKIQRKLKTGDWWPGSPKQLFIGWVLLLKTAWAMSQLPTIRRMGKMRMMMTQSRVSWRKMMNPARRWAESPKPCSRAWTGFGRIRWRLRNRNNRHGTMQPTTGLNERRATVHPDWVFRHLFYTKQMRTQRHLHRQHFERV